MLLHFRLMGVMGDSKLKSQDAPRRSRFLPSGGFFEALSRFYCTLRDSWDASSSSSSSSDKSSTDFSNDAVGDACIVQTKASTDEWVRTGGQSVVGMTTLRELELEIGSDPISRAHFTYHLACFQRGEISLKSLLDAMYLLKQQLSLRVSMRLCEILQKPQSLEKIVSFLFDTSTVDEHPDDISKRYRYPFVSRHILAEGSQQIRLALLHSDSKGEDHKDEAPLIKPLFDYLEKDLVQPEIMVHVVAVLTSLLREDRRRVILLLSKRDAFLRSLVNKIRYPCIGQILTSLIGDDLDNDIETPKSLDWTRREIDRFASSADDLTSGLLCAPAVQYLIDSNVLCLLCEKFYDAVEWAADSALPSVTASEENGVAELLHSCEDEAPLWYQNFQQAENSLSTLITLFCRVPSFSPSIPRTVKTILSTVIVPYVQHGYMLTNPAPEKSPLIPYLLLALSTTLQLLSPPTSVPPQHLFPYRQCLVTILIDLTPSPSPSPVLRLSILHSLFRIQNAALSVKLNRDTSLREQSVEALESVRLPEVMWQVGKKCAESQEIQKVVRKAASDGFGGNLGDEGWKLWMGERGKVGRRVLNEWEKVTSGGKMPAREWKQTVVEVGGWIVGEGGARVERDLGSETGARLRKLVEKEQEIRGYNFWKMNQIQNANEPNGFERRKPRPKSLPTMRGQAVWDLGKERRTQGRRKSLTEASFRSPFEELSREV